ncbi:hypothetical protein [Singulisphaera acidiphila]|uniref:Uncharacterized protein n=1 Tax=Singulisphaera acidiphila (strain ATCC BAA-1392 / DSM 18658 / VKM B-2454 / MOB10) TaxID=886293 RepID=L0DPX7_SINAD|nr:hypothetical protein [Singulisphaera acidiphila]AGA30746.1 hypothetical protein Sinac_6672 [Singulisphaera acidiphila DSM 18658]
MPDRPKKKTPPKSKKFDAPSLPEDAILHDRRDGPKRRGRGEADPATASTKPDRGPARPQVKKERRRRIDPTTFEKQYTDDEIEFMNAMQHFKMQSGRSFPTCGEVLKVANELGYRKMLALRLIQGIDESAPRSEGSNGSAPNIT